MSYQKIGSLAIALIGFYAIFSALVVSGAHFMVLIFSLFQTEWRHFGLTTLALIPQFFVMFVFGVILVRKASRISAWLLSKIEIEKEEKIEGFRIEDLSFLLFTMLGLYMLSTTIPPVLQLFATWFSAKAAETSLYGVTTDMFWKERLPEVVYHITAVGFSCFVFFKGANLSKFVLSLRKIQQDRRLNG